MARAPKSPIRTTDPAVILDVELRDRVLYLRLINRSDRPVLDVQVSFGRKLFGLDGAVDISALPLWSRLAFMAPGKVIEVPLDRAEVFFAKDRGTPLKVSIRYNDADGAALAATITHDLGAYRDLPGISVR